MGGKRIRTKVTESPMNVANRPNDATNSVPLLRRKSVENLQALTKEQLKLECRKRGQKTTGTKTELLQRLRHKMPTNRKLASNGSANAENDFLNTSADVSPLSNKRQEREERESLTLFRKPIITLEFFVKEIFVLSCTYGKKILEFKKAVLVVTISVAVIVAALRIGGPHQLLADRVYIKLMWCLYWIGLGILSSVGLGTGLHTFLLYLGPHIAQVTLAAYECGSLNFPEPPYPDEVVCPSDSDPFAVSIFAIMSKVRLESMCWGAGTALGELPPYFMARAARLSGIDPDEDDDDDLVEFEQLQKKRREDLTWIEKGKLFIEDVVQKVGFFGILACASIPNPLFDLAGITCGHFLVPFWTFFGATLIGKAIIKMHIQKLFVIIAFNEALISTALSWLNIVPVLGSSLQVPFKAFLDDQKVKLHRRGGSTDNEKGSLISWVFEKFVIVMVFYFVISIVNSLAQSYHKRLHKRKKN